MKVAHFEETSGDTFWSDLFQSAPMSTDKEEALHTLDEHDSSFLGRGMRIRREATYYGSTRHKIKTLLESEDEKGIGNQEDVEDGDNEDDNDDDDDDDDDEETDCDYVESNRGNRTSGRTTIVNGSTDQAETVESFTKRYCGIKWGV